MPSERNWLSFPSPIIEKVWAGELASSGSHQSEQPKDFASIDFEADVVHNEVVPPSRMSKADISNTQNDLWFCSIGFDEEILHVPSNHHPNYVVMRDVLNGTGTDEFSIAQDHHRIGNLKEFIFKFKDATKHVENEFKELEKEEEEEKKKQT